MAKPSPKVSPPPLVEVKQAFPIARAVPSVVPALSSDPYLFSQKAPAPLLVFLPISFGPNAQFEVSFAISETGSIVPNGFTRQKGDKEKSLEFVEQMVSLNRSKLLAILRRGPQGNYRIKVLSAKKDYLDIDPSETNPQMQNLPHHYAIRICEALLQRVKEVGALEANSAALLQQTLETFASNDRSSKALRFEIYRVFSSFSQDRDEGPTLVSRLLELAPLRFILFTLRTGWWGLGLWLAVMSAIAMYSLFAHYPHYDKGLQLAARGSYLAAAREFELEVDHLNQMGKQDLSISLQPALMYHKMGDEKSEFRALKLAFQHIGPKTSEKYDQALPPEMRDVEIGSLSCGKEQGIRLWWVRYRALQKKFLP